MLQNDAVVQDHKAISQTKGFFAVVGHVDNGDLALMQDGAQFLNELCPQGMVQRSERFIQHEQVGRRGKRARQCNPLLLAAGEFGDGAICEALHADTLQAFFHAP